MLGFVGSGDGVATGAAGNVAATGTLAIIPAFSASTTAEAIQPMRWSLVITRYQGFSRSLFQATTSSISPPLTLPINA